MDSKYEEIMKKRGYDQWFLLRDFDCSVESLRDWIRYTGRWVSEEVFEIWKESGFIMPADVAAYKSEKIQREILSVECPKRARFKAGDKVKVVGECIYKGYEGTVERVLYREGTYAYLCGNPKCSYWVDEDYLVLYEETKA